MLNQYELFAEKIQELEYKMKNYDLIIYEKDSQIEQLMKENSMLRAQINNQVSYARPAPQPNVHGNNPIPPAYNVNVNLQPNQQSNLSSPRVLKASPTPQYQGYRSQVRPKMARGTTTGILKRICPQCGAMGFDIKEEDDKSQIISYIPRRIYAKKRVCTKCFLEF